MPLTFLPWVRQGVASAVAVQDSSASLTNRATVSVTVTLNATIVAMNGVELLGPGDVTGFDPALVARTDPPPGTTSFETTRFPSVDFVGALPWMFTPAAADGNGRLRPWIVLAVARAQDGVTLERTPEGTWLKIEPPAVPKTELPDLSTLWALAHVQVAGTVDATTLPTVLADSPERWVSRLLCLRQLAPASHYVACVVPAFDAGRAAGVGDDPAPGGTLATAWTGSETSIRLRAYYCWEFDTAAEGGDFLTLAQLLQPGPVPPGVSEMQLDVSSSGLVDNPPLAMHGPLRPDPAAAHTDPPLPPAVREAFATALASSTAPNGKLGLPVYGAAYAASPSVQDGGWSAELNLDPRNRVAAGLGALVVQQEQEPLVAAAWEQAGQVRELNQLLSRGQLARSVNTAHYNKHLAPMPPAVRLQVSGPLSSRLRVAPLGQQNPDRTLRAVVDGSPVPNALLAAKLRELTRPGATAIRARLNVARRVGAAADGTSRTPVNPTPQDAGPAASRPATSAAATALTLSGLLAASPVAAADNGGVGDAGDPVDAAERIGASTLTQFNPEVTVPGRVLPRTQLPTARDPSQFSDTLMSFTVAPQFRTPMFDALQRVAGPFLLPNAQLLPANSVTVLYVNPAFVAAFMVGLNSELGRELLWRGFPLQRRGTFFQYFWDYHGQNAQPVPDMAPIDEWDAGAGLTDAVGGIGGADHLVLVIRGDLLRRYPRTAVSAVRAAGDGSLPDQPGPGDIRDPGFTAFLSPDIRLFGFALNRSEVSGADGGAGWFFLLLEPVTERRFGQEPGQPIALTGTSADVAIAALRAPVLVAIHGKDLVGS